MAQKYNRYKIEYVAPKVIKLTQCSMGVDALDSIAMDLMSLKTNHY